ncbi:MULTISPECIES: DUF47 domain-containing protein [Pseudothermotoga]|jgi:hypothetical protein|uniref:Phosphate transport regulator n=2 Tax=Pseudothermotoga TaxID=1643951 RepID=A8F4P2_PSELT|nr:MULTISPECIES: DUF47 family protein [Pseudothermotoga]ABV33126.1 protein of unknown function DUF47 [Pseudothermotoga lettingae TMO]KUK21055.1 MAG: Uncharacterized protein XD56_1024 [Pseudothermotoga lettingae]MDI3494393.1 uncharacterized protein [Pseudothermotoga sp.]GLI47872.1 TIGR00153 family protein [Pseudothermotoga lettingae TMO]HBJ82169.1 DUF47 domain-containing protein [Pseudothermotoga sp.]
MTRFIDKMFPKQSPLRLLYEHALLTKKVSQFIVPALKNYFEDLPVEKMSEEVDVLEDKADEIKILIRESYTKLKFVYFDRVDILTILHEEDGVIDAVDDFLKALMLNKVEKPVIAEIQNIMIELAESCSDAVEGMVKSVSDLLLLVESSFAPSVALEEDRTATRVESNESNTDKLSLIAGKKIFSLKNAIHPVDIYYLEKLIRLLTRIADHAENVAERVRMITHI